MLSLDRFFRTLGFAYVARFSFSSEFCCLLDPSSSSPSRALCPAFPILFFHRKTTTHTPSCRESATQTVRNTQHEPAMRAVDAFVAGVNAYLSEGHLLPPEYAVLGVRAVRPWTAQDVTAHLKARVFCFTCWHWSVGLFSFLNIVASMQLA